MWNRFLPHDAMQVQLMPSCGGLTENDGPSKLQDMKLQDMKKTDQIAGHESAGHENDGPSSRA